MRLNFWLLVFVLVFTAFVVPGRFVHVATAQAVTSEGWSIPENLSESLTSSGSPAIVADQFGLVHVFWSEDLGGNPYDNSVSSPGGGNAIMYRQLNNGNWSDATDLFYGGNGNRLDSPEAVVDADGNLHLVWTETSGLEYSVAPVWNVTRVQAWQRPVELDKGFVTRVRLLDLGDRLLAVYNIISGEKAGLYSVSIKDDMVLSPELIWSGSANAIPQDIGVARDGRGRVHVVWSISLPPDPAAVEVRYTYMDNESGGWAASRVVAKQTSTEDSLQFAVPWVAARGEDEIHLQWAQGDKAYRWHQYSMDGGKSWTAPRQIWPDLLSQTNSQATGVDSEGRLYWADVLRFPNAGYLMQWSGKEWLRPAMFYEIQHDSNDPMGSRIHIHYIRMAISLGREMYLVFQDQDRAEVWVMHRTLLARETAAEPVPILTPEPESTPVIDRFPLSNAPNIQATPLPGSVGVLNLDDPMVKPGTIILLGILPVMLIIILTALRATRHT